MDCGKNHCVLHRPALQILASSTATARGTTPGAVPSNVSSSVVLARRSRTNTRLRSAGMNGLHLQTGDNREPERFNDGRFGNTRANGGGRRVKYYTKGGSEAE